MVVYRSKPFAIIPLVAWGAFSTCMVQAGDIQLALEEPLDNSQYTGVANIRGWVVGSVGIDRVELYVDGALMTHIPMGGLRADVGDGYPQYPDSSNSGFSMAYNYSNLITGQHTIRVRAIDQEGAFKDVSATFNSTRFDNPFISDPSKINLDQAIISHDTQSILINNMTADGKTYDIKLGWRTAIQGYAITEITPTGGNQSLEPNSIENIVNDMTLPNEGMPHGVPSYWDWAVGPVIHAGNHPLTSLTALASWGVLYEDAAGSPAKNTRVQLRGIQSYRLSKQDKKWHLLQNSVTVEGYAYAEDFTGDQHKDADIRSEGDGTISVTAGGGYNFHFWVPYPNHRVSIDPNDIAGVFTTVQARLIVGDPNQPDDRASARYLLGMGADYWTDKETGWAQGKGSDDQCEEWIKGGGKNCGVANGRLKYVTDKWQSFNMITIEANEIRQNPPPHD